MGSRQRGRPGMIADEFNAPVERPLLKMAGGEVLLQGEMQEADIAGRLLDEEPGSFFGELEDGPRLKLRLFGIGGALPGLDELDSIQNRVLFGGRVIDCAAQGTELEGECEVGDEAVAQLIVHWGVDNGEGAGVPPARLMFNELGDNLLAGGKAALRQGVAVAGEVHQREQEQGSLRKTQYSGVSLECPGEGLGAALRKILNLGSVGSACVLQPRQNTKPNLAECVPLDIGERVLPTSTRRQTG
jgi:hypothetical protein